MPSSLKNRITGSVAAAMLAAVPMMTSAAPANAGAILCLPGETEYSVSGVSSAWTVTHVKKKHIAAGQSYKEGTTATAARVTTLHAKLTQDGSVSVSAGVKAEVVYGEVEAKVGFAVEQEGSSTETTSISVSSESSIAAKSSERDFAVYKGYKKVSGSWKKLTCSADGKTMKTTTGDFTNFGPDGDGWAQCPKTRFKSTSLEYKACNAIS